MHAPSRNKFVPTDATLPSVRWSLRALLMCTVISVIGCTSTLQRVDQFAARLGLQPVGLTGTSFVHHDHLQRAP